MSEELFTVFQEVNLPVNTWPYLRSFLADGLGRMGWPPMTLPAFKTGIQSPSVMQERPLGLAFGLGLIRVGRGTMPLDVFQLRETVVNEYQELRSQFRSRPRRPH